MVIIVATFSLDSKNSLQRSNFEPHFSQIEAQLESGVEKSTRLLVLIQLRNGKKTGVLILTERSSGKNLYSVYRPNIGLIHKPETWEEISKKYTKVCLALGSVKKTSSVALS